MLIKDVPLANLSANERAKRIGYLPQNAPLHWNVTIDALVALGRYPHSDLQSLVGRSAIDRAMAELELQHFAHRLVDTLSGGERARAMLARVLAGEPSWILVDEPLAALDIAHRYALFHQLRSIASRGVGIVIVAHNLGLVARMTDDAVLLDGGRLVAAGTASDVLVPEQLGQVFGANFEYVRGTDGNSVLVSAPAGIWSIS